MDAMDHTEQLDRIDGTAGADLEITEVWLAAPVDTAAAGQQPQQPRQASWSGDRGVELPTYRGADAGSERQGKHGSAADVLRGAIAGALATWVMGRVTSYLYDHESRRVRREEDSARHGTTADEMAAKKAAHLVGADLTPQEQRSYGSGIHWGLGIAAGALYGAIRDDIPLAGPERALAYGTAFWLLIDETATSVLGISPGPTSFPWQTHARGLAAHLAFAATTESALAMMP